MPDFLTDTNSILSYLVQLGILGAVTTFLTNKFKSSKLSGALAAAIFSVAVGVVWTIITWYGAEQVVFTLARNIAGALGTASVIYGFFQKQVNKAIPPLEK